MLHLKGLRDTGSGKKAIGWDGEILKELRGLPGGRAWFAGDLPAAGGRIVPA